MKKGRKWIPVVLLVVVLLGNRASIPVQAAEEQEYVVIVDEYSPLKAFVENQKERTGYVLAEQHAEADTIIWKPFYVTLAVLIVAGGGTVHVLVTRRRKRDHNIGKRGL